LFESLSGMSAEVVGKPNRLMLEMAARVMGVPVGDTIMIGDRLSTDIRMAVDAGTESILVLTGETSTGDLITSSIKPTYVVNSVADIPDMLQKQMASSCL
jgi:ribonucleotide monophosphatase NagD (HAD superfamily)